MEYMSLWNGQRLPAVALGTYKSQGEELLRAVQAAVDSGYRSFDSAALYDNEADLCRAIHASGEPRQELFVTSKVWIDHLEYDAALASFEESEKKLERIDMLLIHWPAGEKFLPAWKALERIYEEKRVKAIGVSNFLPHHLELLAQHAHVKPMVNQIEAHVFYMDWDTIARCQTQDVLVEAWSPLGRMRRVAQDPTIAQVAQAHQKTPAQVALRYLIQHGLRVLPKSVTPERIRENIALFDFALSAEEMRQLKKLSHPSGRKGDDPNSFGV